MHIQAYNLDSLRKIIRSLQDENRRLRDQLSRANIPCETSNIFIERIENIEEYDPDQGGRILDRYITKDLANQFFSFFWGRTDVYAKRGRKGGYFPQCNNRWNDRICPKQRKEKLSCEACEHREWTKLTPEKIIDHLVGYKEDGSDVLGVYPLFSDGTCRFIVFDFDNHEKGAEQTDFANVTEEWNEEVDALRLICESNGITPLVERSRSGRGAHVWIFFKKPVSASLARNFGFLLLDKGSASINLKSFHYYDRMYPSQDVASSIGNLIALPLQGRALRNGNSAFVDKNWNAYPDQWDILLNHTKKLSMEDIIRRMKDWQEELSGYGDIPVAVMQQNRPKPWRKKGWLCEVGCYRKNAYYTGERCIC
ncbi:TOTE conflict system archaeo-eukaryotic primase domain-containing protein [Enterocloster citroniae]|uniref:TOTE conflict system archaeo-eukaryotic primase domain-containing protein n=2 Tax=Enterocloster citroniae TaxID=358743 RepID=UPI00349EF2AD